MTQPLTPIRVQFSKAGNHYRLEASISRLLPRELPQVIEAFTLAWTKPEEIERVAIGCGRGSSSGEALAVTLMADREIPAGDRPEDISRRLTYAVWRKLDRFVMVTIETTYLGESPDAHFEYGEVEYAQAFEARFER